MIEYDKPIEVTKAQYDKLIVKCAGIIAHRQHEGKYYVKVWMMKHKDLVKFIIETT